MINLKLNKRVEIHLEKFENVNGSMELSTKKLCVVWAEVRSVKADEKISNGELLENEMLNVVIRYRRTVTTKCRVKYNDKFYNISHIQELGNRDGMKMVCKQVNE